MSLGEVFPCLHTTQESTDKAGPEPSPRNLPAPEFSLDSHSRMWGRRLWSNSWEQGLMPDWSESLGAAGMNEPGFLDIPWDFTRD